MRKYLLQSVLISSLILILPTHAYSQSGTETDQEKLAADQNACREHAKAYSGYDPSAPDNSSQAPRAKRGAGLRGAARGAAAGALTGEVVERVGDEEQHDDAAEVGAAIGAVRGGLKGRRASKAQAKAQVQAAPVAQQGSTKYAESYNECMRSRGYTVE